MSWMAWQDLRDYVIDGLFVVGSIAVGGPVMIVMATFFCGVL